MWNIEAVMNGSVIDLTNDVLEASISYGSARANMGGAMLAPGVGTLTLNNQSGKFNFYDPASDIDTLPGPHVRVQFAGQTIFQGWSGGIMPNHIGTSGRREPIMKLVGAAARVFGYHQRLFLDIAGEHTVSDVVTAMLDNVNWPTRAEAKWPDVGATLVYPSRTLVHAFGLEQASIVISGRSRVQLQDALHALAVLEFGRIYDNHIGQIVFEDRDTLWARRLDAAVDLINNSQTFKYRDPFNGILNVIGTTTAEFLEGGAGVIPVQVFGVDAELPAKFTIPAFGALNLLYSIDTNVWDFVNWDDPIRGNHFTSTTGVAPLVQTTERDISLSFSNPHHEEATVVINKFTGQRFRATGQRVLTARNDVSVARYGEQEVTVNTLPYVNTDTHKDFAEFLVAGLGEPNPFIEAQYILDTPTIFMDSLLNITEDKEGIKDDLYSVESVTYETMDVKDKIRVSVVAARQQNLRAWLLESTDFDNIGRVTY